MSEHSTVTFDDQRTGVLHSHVQPGDARDRALVRVTRADGTTYTGMLIAVGTGRARTGRVGRGRAKVHRPPDTYLTERVEHITVLARWCRNPLCGVVLPDTWQPGDSRWCDHHAAIVRLLGGMA